MRGQTILVTGCSGTFGTAFIRYALHRGAARVIGLSTGEHRQVELERAINDARLECWLKDVSDRDDMMWAMRAKPDVVVHAAACKRVEKCESNPQFAFKTNVLGTRHVVEEAMLAGVPKVLLISSDKATSAETAYGKTKAAAEEIAIGQNAYRGDSGTRISAVRYGNVLGSDGSFLNTLFAARRTGATISITDPTHTRYWWAIEDAVAFVGSVLEQMRGAEIWVPKLVSSKVTELATAVAPNCAQRIVGTRGPEKAHEAMISATESAFAWDCGDRYVLLPKAGQWWSPPPPNGAVKVPAGFTYSSDQACVPVSFYESREDTPCSVLPS